jgi:DNA-binding NtrC family response regulator
LRERASDIPELVEHFLNETAREMDLCPTGITDDAVGRLTGYRWPGNVRELKNAIRFAVIKSRGTPVDVQHLPPHVLGDRDSKPGVSRRRKLERSTVRKALESTRGNKSEAARVLGVSRATLYRFLDEAGTS